MTKILCIEDEPAIQEDIVEELIDCGYEVVTATNGLEGLEAILNEDPNLIICDCLMPVMTGTEMFKVLRRDYPEHSTKPFVFMSAHAEKQHISEGADMGVDAYLTKPVNFDVLVTTIEGLLAPRKIGTTL